ncbi:HNH endonuclease [Citromicrobium bathyomarinum]|uniref:HNH endonuclease n=1 Tax=Citromicrobium bathyomarinum TaxID=72174 RepID=UPI0022A96890|nr:HNH endonuclease [Citromicrobium bathyomarinum]
MVAVKDGTCCIYCDEPLEGGGSLEHIWPQGLGGAACPDPWRSNDVCRKCNSKAGLWVDGPFLKGSFTFHEKRISNEAFIGNSVIDRAGYTYMGQERSFPCSPEELSEFWLGPSGETCRFVHADDGERWATYAGGNPMDRKKRDPGRVYLSLVDRGQVRALMALASVCRTFPKARVHCLTQLTGLPPKLADRLIRGVERSKIEDREIEWIRNDAPQEVQVRATISTNFEQRFLGKLALGVGANLLGRAHLSTSYAASLRDLFHTGKGNEVRGAGYWQEGLAVPLGLEGAWTLSLWAIGDLALFVTSPSGKNMMIVVAPADSITDDLRNRFGDGQSWVIVPIRRFCSEPIALPDLIAHSLNGLPVPQLGRLSEWRSEAEQLWAAEETERENAG